MVGSDVRQSVNINAVRVGKIVIAHFSDLFGHTFKAHALTADNISVEKHKHKADGYESHEKHEHNV